MEDTLRAFLPYFLSIVHLVLILVLMEDTLRAQTQVGNVLTYRLNPCFNGRYSQSDEDDITSVLAARCLNPCFNGRYSQRAKTCVPLFIVV